jgi:hypothetical protein
MSKTEKFRRCGIDPEGLDQAALSGLLTITGWVEVNGTEFPAVRPLAEWPTAEGFDSRADRAGLPWYVRPTLPGDADLTGDDSAEDVLVIRCCDGRSHFWEVQRLSAVPPGEFHFTPSTKAPRFATPGQVRVLLLEPGRPPVVQDLPCDPEADFQKVLGCDCLEGVHLARGVTGWTDGMALVRPDGPRPRNELATMICHRLGRIDPSFWITGPMVIAGIEGEEGYECDAPDWIVQYILQVHRDPLGAVPIPEAAIDWHEKVAAALRDRKEQAP